MVLAAVCAVAIALDVQNHGLLDHLDHRIGDRMSDWDLRHDDVARPLLTLLLYFGQRGVVLVLSLALFGWLAWRQRTLEPLLRLLVALVLIFGAIYACKLGLARNAPIDEARGHPSGYGASFPSGHVTNAVVLWGLADWSVRAWRTPSQLRRLIRIGRIVAPLAVTVSMTLLNYHWLSDFLGGAAIGTVVLAITLLPVWGDVGRRTDIRAGLRPSAVP